MEKQLQEGYETLLRYINEEEPTQEELFKGFVGVYTSSVMKQFVRALKDLRYIKKEERVLFATFSENGNDLQHSQEIYTLTPLGKNFLLKSTANVTSFSNITNSNIANNSPGSQQTIKVSEQPQDIQEKVKELELAVLKKDAPAIKKTFGYIADKSVDIAIALLAGTLLR